MRSDLYALGATMHNLLSGRPPVPFKFPAISSLRPDVSAAMEAVLERALKLNADERYGTAREMREAMEGGASAPAKAAGGGARVSPTSVQSHVGSSPPPVKAAQIRLSPAPAGAAQPGASPAPSPSLPATMTNTRDGAEMVLISAGEFLMSSPAGKGSDDERPQHRVFLDAYYIYRYEVTNRKFAEFVKATGYSAEGDWKKYAKSGKEKHPVVNVTWNDAAAYCRWAGGRLPTEAQW